MSVEHRLCAESNMKRILQEDGGISFRFTNKEGTINRTRYPVFPGVEVVYQEAHILHSPVNLPLDSSRILAIDYCRNGTLLYGTAQEQFHLIPGDIVIHFMKQDDVQRYPAGHYCGIMVQIDLEKSSDAFTSFLETAEAKPDAIINRFHVQEQMFYLLPRTDALLRIFVELNDAAKREKAFFRLKVLELFLFLSSMEQEEHRKVPEAQAILARNVRQYVEEHLEKHITLAELASRFDVSTTQIKNSFHHVYNTSVYAYVKGQRMHAAADLLSQTDRTILDIASQLGYANGSKFASAFCSVMGVTPSQYRKGITRSKEK